MSAPVLPGVHVRTPFTVREVYTHQHTWETTERVRDGRLFKLHVCRVGHEKPVIQPYEVIVLSPAEEVMMREVGA